MNHFLTRFVVQANDSGRTATRWARRLVIALHACVMPFLLSACATEKLVYRLPVSKQEVVLACMRQQGGACPSAAELGRSLQSSEVEYWDALAATASRSAAAEGRSALGAASERSALARDAVAASAKLVSRVTKPDSKLPLDEKTLRHTRRAILEASVVDAFDELSVTASAGSDPNALASARAGGERDLATTAQFISQYLKAYFRNGKFSKLTLDPDALKEKIKAEITEQLKGTTKAEDIEKLAAKLTAKLQTKEFGTVSDTAFVARGGKSYQFKEVGVTFTPEGDKALSITKIDSVGVVADLTRVVIEAMFDSRDRLPAVANATGVVFPSTLDPKPIALIENNPCAEGDANPDCARMLSADRFAKVEGIAAQVDGITLGLVGGIVRGGSVFALNNEHLAAFIENAIATSARKTTEKIAWCVSTCEMAKTGDARGGRDLSLSSDIGSDRVEIELKH